MTLRDSNFLVVCECGWAKGYDSHPEASAAQAGHATACKGPRTRIFTET